MSGNIFEMMATIIFQQVNFLSKSICNMQFMTVQAEASALHFQLQSRSIWEANI